jgi:hypothetical protein
MSYYDNELILLAAQRGDLKVEHIQEMDEMIQNPFLYEKQETVVEDTLEETVFQLQQEVIRQLAEKESAVFVGRCADEALRKAGYDWGADDLADARVRVSLAPLDVSVEIIPWKSEPGLSVEI